MKTVVLLAAAMALTGPALAKGSSHGSGAHGGAASTSHQGAAVGGRPATITRATSTPAPAAQAAGTNGTTAKPPARAESRSAD